MFVSGLQRTAVLRAQESGFIQIMRLTAVIILTASQFLAYMVMKENTKMGSKGNVQKRELVV